VELVEKKCKITRQISREFKRGSAPLTYLFPLSFKGEGD
jgi:hypothetical protein